MENGTRSLTRNVERLVANLHFYFHISGQQKDWYNYGSFMCEKCDI